MGGHKMVRMYSVQLYSVHGASGVTKVDVTDGVTLFLPHKTDDPF